MFVQIELRMNWLEFCSSKMYFIMELREIISSEKKVVVEDGQFKISNMPSEVKLASTWDFVGFQEDLLILLIGLFLLFFLNHFPFLLKNE